jgi:FKBP-type peptidyl-prolyl cis-trans isomerase FkpA
MMASKFHSSLRRIVFLLVLTATMTTTTEVVHAAAAAGVVVQTTREGRGPAVGRDHVYSSHVTLYIENKVDGTKTPSGWSTRMEHGAPADAPFEFQPGKNLIPGWTEGVLRMVEGERAEIHVPPELGYGGRPMGSPGGAFYIPADSHLLFDIEILGKAGEEAAAAAVEDL